MSCTGGCGGKCGPCRVKNKQAAMRQAVGSVFVNYTGRETPNRFLRQMKPNHGTYAWLPNTTLSKRQGPQERGATFVNSNRSGVGAINNTPQEVVVGAENMGVGKRS